MDILKPGSTEDLSAAIENAPAMISETSADELSAICVIDDDINIVPDQVAALCRDGGPFGGGPEKLAAICVDTAQDGPERLAAICTVE